MLMNLSNYVQNEAVDVSEHDSEAQNENESRKRKAKSRWLHPVTIDTLRSRWEEEGSDNEEEET